ncbi:hypothetical protein SeLEV6574_g07344 [Synchytrium endobioticum]|uniref:TOG domain-containing protein n=1 Tax=Synchytrium endobioticum TaxID=286115 RepID=A0A507CLD6_9FUNG|nr:hypothetical protein SeLEV6574_g07344 [Synchytrium endobioticum]
MCADNLRAGSLTTGKMADKEKELLEAVEFRFALADTAAKFQDQIMIYLAPVLLKLDSPHASVKTMVTTICGHVNKRLKSDPSINIPLSAILDLWTSTTVTNFVRNFALIYLEIGFARASDKAVTAFLPQLIRGIATRLPSQQMVAFHIALPIFAKLKEVQPPSTDPFEFEANPADLSFLVHQFLNIMLYNIPASSRPKATSAAAPMSAAQPPHQTEPVNHAPPGLSRASVEFITNAGKAAFTKSTPDLVHMKVQIIKFLTSNYIPEKLLVSERFTVYLVASCETNHLVVGAGEDAMKRYAKPDFEDENVVRSLYQLYQGSTKGAAIQSNPDPQYRMPANAAVKCKVVSYLSKSAKAANLFPSMVQIIFDALYGEATNSKLRSLGMTFVIWVSRMSEAARIRPVAPVLVSGLLKLIEQRHDNEAQAAQSAQEAEVLRGFAYEAIGLVSRRAPELFANDMTILTSFFKALSIETRNVRISVQDALTMMIDAYKNTVNDEMKRTVVEEIILTNIEKNEPPARYIATKYAVSLFPFSHTLSRYIALVASADSQLEVREEGHRGLKFPQAIPPYDTPETYAPLLPSFTQMVSLLIRMRNRGATGMTRAPGVEYLGGLSIETYSNALQMLQRILMRSGDPNARIGEIGVMSEETNEIAEACTRASVRQILKQLWNEGQVDKMEVDCNHTGNLVHPSGGLSLYIDLIEDALKADESDAVLQSVASSCLLELISLGTSSLSTSYSTKVAWIKKFLSSMRTDTRHNMAHILGLVATAAQVPFLLKELHDFIKNPPRANPIESKHGATLAMGFIIGRLWYRYPHDAAVIVTKQQLKTCIETMLSILNDESGVLVTAACVAVGEMCRYALLPLEAAGATSSSDWTVTKVFEKLASLSKTSKEIKVQEAAISALGDLALGDPSVRSSVTTALVSLCAALSKQPEVHFTVGAALAIIGGGWQAINTSVFLDLADVAFLPASSLEVDENMDNVLAKCFAEVAPGRPVTNRRAVSVWLLSLIRYCGHHTRVKARFGEIHSALSSLLNDRDDFTQEVASKAIGLSYELADAPMRKAMVESLINTITEGKRLAGQSVTADTTLFEAGSLGAAPDGSNLSTYQSILSLASDMNQPELVYKFMSLASHSALWNSRRGASMGFAMVMSHAEEDLKPYLPTLVPRLYRFQFDPNTKVADAMRNIWKILIKDPKHTIDGYFVVIIKDLLKSMGDRMWRTREASCVAMSDLLHGRSIEQLEPYLQELWTMCFRVLDDIKESVRTAAFGTCKILTNVTIRYCDPSIVSVKDGQKVMDACMPFFLTQGLGSMADEVRKFALSTVLKLCKKGGVLLRPHVTDITMNLLESLSSLEPQVMNYLSFHTETYNVTQEQLDSSRLSAAKMSPMMEAITTCVEQIDGKVLETLVPKLNQLIRKAVGLPTKAGCARFIALLAARPQELSSCADSILKALSGAIFDKSPAVCKTYAVAAGHIVKLVNDNSLSKFIQHLKKMYIDSEDEETRAVPGIVFYEMTKQAPDQMKNYLGEILPLAYYGGRDAHDAIKTVWLEVWDGNNSTGTASALRMYLNELLDLLIDLLKTSASWPTKRQVGVTIKDMSASMSSSLIPQLPALISALIEALAGRTWDGKESVIDAFGCVIIVCAEWFESEGRSHTDEVSGVLIREAKKNSKPYKRVALEVLGKSFAALRVDRLDDLMDYLVDTATFDEDDGGKVNGDKMDVDQDSREKPLTLLVKANAFKALAGCFPPVEATQSKHIDLIIQVLAKSMDNNTWNVRLSAVNAAQQIIEKLLVPLSEANSQLLIQGLFKPLADMKYVALREAGIKALNALFERTKSTMTKSTGQILIRGLDILLERESISSIKGGMLAIRKETSGMDLA